MQEAECMKPYTIQEFADLSGVSIDRLRHYEKLNLMKPRRNVRNGYRYYSDEHLLDVYRICFMQSLNVPLKDIPMEIEERKAEERIAQRIGEMEAEIARLRMQMERLSSIRREMERREERQAQLRHTQKYYVLFYDQIGQSEKGKEVVAQWMRHASLVYPVFEIHTDAIIAPEKGCLQPRMGLAIEKRYADELGLVGAMTGIEEGEGIVLSYGMYLASPMNPNAEELTGILDHCRNNGIDLGKRLLYRVTAEKAEDTGYKAQACIPVDPA